MILRRLSQEMTKRNRWEDDIFEPEEWTGERCTDQQFSDWGINDDSRGPGSCRFDCDCPPCAPFCNGSLGFCDNDKYSRTPSSSSECYESDNGGHFSITGGFSSPCIKRCRLDIRRKRCVSRFFPVRCPVGKLKGD